MRNGSKVMALGCMLALAVAMPVFGAGEADQTAAAPEADESPRALIGELEGVRILRDFVPATYQEAPMLAEMVAAGELPPVEERVGPEPLVLKPIHEIGTYGGTWRRGFIGPNDGANATRAVLHDRPLHWNYTETEIVPNVARDWEVSADGRTTTLHLRQGMRWSDGAPFTADDWVFWYDHMATNNDLRRGGIGELMLNGKPVRVVKVSDTAVAFVSDDPYYGLLNKLASTSWLSGHGRWGGASGGGFAPAHYIKQFHPDFIGQDKVEAMAKEAGFDNWALFVNEKNRSWLNPELPIVSAWQVTVPITEETFEWKRNAYSMWMDEAGNQLPYIDFIVMTKGENLEVLNLRAIAGEFDSMARHMDLRKLPVFLENEEKGNYKVHLDTSQHGGDAAIYVNSTFEADAEIGKWLGNVDFRRALSLGIDRDAINEVFFLGLGTPGSIAPEETTIYSPGPDSEWRTLWSTHDPDTANRMLDEMGLDQKDAEGYRLRTDGGGRLVIELMTYLSFMDFTGLGEMVKEQYQQIGIFLDVKEYERSLSGRRVAANEHHLTINVPWGAGNVFGHPTALWPNRANAYQGPLWGEWIATGGESGREPPAEVKRVNELYQMAKMAPPDEAAEMAKEMWRIILDQQWMIGTVGLSPTIQGVRIVSNNLGNIPARQMNNANTSNPNISRPEQWFFKNM